MGHDTKLKYYLAIHRWWFFAVFICFILSNFCHLRIRRHVAILRGVNQAQFLHVVLVVGDLSRQYSGERHGPRATASMYGLTMIFSTSRRPKTNWSDLGLEIDCTFVGFFHHQRIFWPDQFGSFFSHFSSALPCCWQKTCRLAQRSLNSKVSMIEKDLIIDFICTFIEFFTFSSVFHGSLGSVRRQTVKVSLFAESPTLLTKNGQNFEFFEIKKKLWGNFSRWSRKFAA